MADKRSLMVRSGMMTFCWSTLVTPAALTDSPMAAYTKERKTERGNQERGSGGLYMPNAGGGDGGREAREARSEGDLFSILFFAKKSKLGGICNKVG